MILFIDGWIIPSLAEHRGNILLPSAPRKALLRKGPRYDDEDASPPLGMAPPYCR